MKSILLSSLLIAAQLLTFGGSASVPTTEASEVIVTLDAPDGVDAYSYALECAEALTSRIPGAEYGYIYDTLLCGFSLTLPKWSVSALSSLGFVDTVYGVGEYEALSAEEIKTFAARSVSVTESVTDGLTGDGVKVAVIDNSFDVTHPAFDVTVTETLDIDAYAMKPGIPVRLNAMKYVINVQKFYHSAKIPFVFDYADHDTDVLDEKNNHGTHVAGIIGAAATDENEMHGIAPDCQLLLMKVFSDGAKTATDSALIAALEDAVRLEADVINLSIGHYAGSADMSVIGLDKVIEKVRESGVTLICAVGNHGVTTDRANTDLPLATYTDYGTVSSPATAAEAIAVASVDSAVIYGEHFKGTDGTPYYYLDTNIVSGVTDITFSEYFEGRTLEYVAVPGVGEESDYENLDVNGKLVLIERGTIPFTEKANIAAAHGALGAIIYNNVANEYANMDLTGAIIPALAITLEDGKALLLQEEKKLSFSAEYIYVENSDSAGEISHFSSWGVTPSLTLKPDVAAIGGYVYSTVIGGYGTMSGTSMAAPQLTGITALLIEKQHSESGNGNIMNAITNTASPVLQSNGVEYSPRAQGAGLINLSAALERNIEITHTKNGKTKAELFDKLGNTFFFDVTLKNLTDEPLEASLSATLTNDGYIRQSGEYYSTLTAEADVKSLITADESGNINRYSEGFAPLALTLGAGEEKTVTLTFTLDTVYHKRLARIFSNGYFAEGFVYCEGGGTTVSLPYMGYIGDFTSGSVADGDAYTNGSTMFGSTKFMLEIDGSFSPAGTNIFAGSEVFDGDTVAFSPNGDGYADEIFFAATHIRNSRSAVMTVYAADGEIIRTSKVDTITKTAGKDQAVVFYFSWDGGDGMHSFYKMPDGDYTFEVIYTLDYGDNSTQKFSYNVKLDTELPHLTEMRLSGNRLTVAADDNSGVRAIRVYEGGPDGVSYLEADGEAVFNISDIKSDIIYYEITDEAYNTLVGRVSVSEIRKRSGK